uniref:Rho GTPase activating protein 33 n=1 Tax=Sphenodon punctatus TaxID=8508 RepID=A0A8D0L3X1_SPHPU
IQARSTDSLDTTGEGLVRPLGNAATSVKGKPTKRLSVARGHFPKLAECAHFHYEVVDFGHIQLQLAPERSEGPATLGEDELLFIVQVTCQGKSWPVHRSYDEFRTLDAHLHRCIFDRRFSQLPELPPPATGHVRTHPELVVPMLLQYLEKLSVIVDSNINCGPVLTWMEIDNHGNRLLVNEEASINVPAIAAAHVIKRYTAQAPDELSFEVGDIVSVIDMPPKEDRSWWRGKHGFQVGEVACWDAVEGAGTLSTPGKHGKLIGFLRTFMKSRPSKQRLKQRGILRERVFGCDLGEHLMNSGCDGELSQAPPAPAHLLSAHREHEFDSERVPELTKDVYLQDIHCVSSLCKLYFRELPNPLLTYQLYDKFAEAMSVSGEEERQVRVHDVIQQLPPPHYRTLEFLMRHLARVAMHSQDTSMHIRNLAIVWAPNLLRSMGPQAHGPQGSCTPSLLLCSWLGDRLLSALTLRWSPPGRCFLPRPKSLLISCPSTRLLTLEEAQARTQAQALALYAASAQEKITKLEGGGRPRKPAGPSWKTFFAIGKGPATFRKKSHRLGELFGLGETQPCEKSPAFTAFVVFSALFPSPLTSPPSILALARPPPPARHPSVLVVGPRAHYRLPDLPVTGSKKS